MTDEATLTPPPAAEPATPVKPGAHTTEFYFALAAKLLGALLATGILADGSAAMRIAGLIAVVLSSLGYTVSRTLVKLAGMLLLLSLVTTQPACGASSRERTIRSTYDATNTAATELEAYSKDHEAALVAKATSAEQARAELAAFRERVDHAEKALAGVYRAIATAALLKDDRSTTALLQVALLLSAELHELGIGGAP